MFKKIAALAVIAIGTWTPTLAAEPFETIDNITRIYTLYDAEINNCGLFNMGGFTVVGESNVFAPEILKEILRATGYRLTEEETEKLKYVSEPVDYAKVREAFLTLAPTVEELKAFDDRLAMSPFLKMDPLYPELNAMCEATEQEAIIALKVFRTLKHLDTTELPGVGI